MYDCICLKMKAINNIFKLKYSSFVTSTGDLLADSLLFGFFEK